MTLQRNTVISLLYGNRHPIKMADLSLKANISERALRLIIADIRENNLLDGYVLCSDDSGYFISNESEVINQWLNRYLSYAFSMLKTSKAAKQFISEKDANEIQLQLNF